MSASLPDMVADEPPGSDSAISPYTELNLRCYSNPVTPIMYNTNHAAVLTKCVIDKSSPQQEVSRLWFCSCPMADRFQLKPPFRSLIVLTYSSIPVNDTTLIRHTSAEITMAFKLQVLDTADSANIQLLGPDCACAIKYCRADRAAYLFFGRF